MSSPNSNVGIFVHQTIVTIVFAFFGVCFGTTPAVFVFGDSLLDPGNNNYLASLSKANFHPYGVDFGEATGRYTNGRTIVDIIGQELGLKNFLPPYLSPTTNGPIVLNGVNYASGGGGIFNITGTIFGEIITLDAQIGDFANTRADIFRIIGEEKGSQLIKNSMLVLVLGSNDFLDNYLLPVIAHVKRKLASPPQFVASLISRYKLQITRLYNMGGRKFVVGNVGPIGCIPYQRDLNPLAGDNCVEFSNYIAKLFNAQLKTLVSQLIASLEGSMFVYADAYHALQDILDNYQSYGFENANSACCHLAGRFGGLIPCNPASKFCPDRSKYVFWDTYHPTDVANVIIAKRFLDGDSSYVWPITVRQLAQF